MTNEELIAKLPSEICDLLETLQNRSEGYDVYIGGGCLADFYKDFNNDLFEHYSPKDIDVFFTPKKNASNLTLPTIPRSYVNYDLTENDIADDMKARGVVSLRGLFVPSLNITSDVQFIVYGDHLTQEELAADMDCNVNQVMYSNGEWFHTEAFEDGHNRGVVMMLHTFSENRMARRLLRMQEKFNYQVDTDIDLEYYDYLKDTPQKGGSMCED